MRYILTITILILVYSCTTNNRTKSVPHPSDEKMSDVLKEEETKSKELEVEQPALVEGTYVTEESKLNLYEISVELEPSSTKKDQPIVSEDQISDVRTKEEQAKKEAEGKTTKAPPMQVFRVRLKIKNKSRQPIWYMMPYNGATTLPPKGHFKAASGLNSNANILQASSCLGEVKGTQLIQLNYNGQPNQHFRAFYIPAQSSMTLKNYNIDCWQEADKIELWAVEELWVNGLYPLQNWMPLNLLSSQDVSIACNRESGCLCNDLEPDASFQAKPETLDYIQANKISKYTVQLESGQ